MPVLHVLLYPVSDLERPHALCYKGSDGDTVGQRWINLRTLHQANTSAHLSPKHLTSAVRMLDVQANNSLDSYLTIPAKPPSEARSCEVMNQAVGSDNELIELKKKDGAEAGS